MTEKKPLREQIAFQSYQPQPRTRLQRREPAHAGAPAGVGAGQHLRQRVVTTPHEVVHPEGWTAMAERREKRRTPYKGPVKQPVARTLAQTGLRASSGRMQAVRPQPRREPNPIPRRSSRRLRRHNRGGLWKLLGMLFVLVVGMIGAGFAVTGSAFRIQQVTVSGTQNRALINDIQHLGMHGQNFFLVDTNALTVLVGRLPLVASASVERQWPNQLTVTVIERTPRVLWQTPRGAFSVDASGMVIARTSSAAGSNGLPVVVDARKLPANQSLQPGSRLSAGEIAFALQAFQQVPALTGITDFSLRYESTIYVSNANSAGKQTVDHTTFVIVSNAGWLAYLGGSQDPNPLENRLRELKQLLSLAQQNKLNLATIDLRFGLNPAYTLKN